MKKFLLVISIILLIVSTTNAQAWLGTSHTISVGMGWSTMLGDLGGGPGVGTYGLKDFDRQAMSPAYTLGYMVTKDKGKDVGVSFKLDASYSRVNSCDNYTENEARKIRQASRITDIVELYAGLEFYFLKQSVSSFKRGSLSSQDFRRSSRSSSVRSKIPFSMYFILGVGAFWYDCKGKYTDGNWYSLRELNTEGQGFIKTRKQTFPVQPVGVLGLGIKYLITPVFAMKAEASMRFTFTDYLDDISATYISPTSVYEYVLTQTGDKQKAEMARYFADGKRLDGTLAPGQIRGNALKNDTYFSVQLGFCFVIQGKNGARKSYYR